MHTLVWKIVAILPDHETLTLSQLVKITKGKSIPIKRRLKELVAEDYLEQKRQVRGAHYFRSQAF